MKEQYDLTLKNDRMSLLKLFLLHEQNKKTISMNTQICNMSETVLDLNNKKLYYLETPFKTIVKAPECKLVEDE